jgi:fucose permease
VWTAVVFSRRRGMAIGSVVVAGLIFGPIFPTIMALLLGHFPQSLHGRAVGLFFAIGGLGWTAIPMLIGAYAQRTSVQRGFVMAAASAVGLCAIALALFLSASG